MKVFLYERVSSEEQVKHGYSLDAQHEALTEFCDRHNHVILGTYKDEGISGRKPYTKRPAMVQLLRDLEIIKPDIILFTKLDRWFRNIKEYYKVQDILDANKVYWKAINEEYDTSTASGRLYVNIKLSIAQDEADRTSERIKDIQSQLIMQGKVLGGSVPFGYKIVDKRIVFSDDIHIVKDAVNHYLTYQSAHATTRYINEKYGLTFNHTRLLKLFSKSILKGAYRQNQAYCEPLLTPTEWDKLQETIQRNVKHASNKRVYLFTGLIRCPHCGRKLGGVCDGSSKRYRCTERYYGNCPLAHNVSEKKLESWLLEHIEKDFDVEVRQKPKQKQESPKKYQDRLKRLNDIYLMGNITESEYKQQAQELQKKIATLSKQPALVEDVFVKNWKDVYRMLDDAHRRAFWRGLVREIKIDPDGKPIAIEFLY